MPAKETAFHFQLSPAELHWLAGAFGQTRLPLPDDPLRALPPVQREAQLMQALASLQTRGLIRRAPGLGWQVDRLPAALVRWMGAAEWMLAAEIHTREGISRRAGIFNEQTAGMSVTLEGSAYRFVLYRDFDALIAGLLAWLGASFADPAPAAPTYTLHQPLTILRAAWQDAALAAKMLKRTGLSPKETKAALAWLESLQWAAALTRLHLEAQRPQAEAEAILCADGQRVWAGLGAGDESGALSLKPISLPVATALFQGLLYN